MLRLVVKAERLLEKKRSMKRYCKNVDITDRRLISKAVKECLKGKIGRRDVVALLSEYTHTPQSLLRKIVKDKQYKMLEPAIETVIDGIRHEILQGKYHWKPIWYTYKKECDKIRRIGIQGIKQQLYDYIAVYGLREMLQKRIGYYQCAAIKNKGQVVGKNAIKKWLRNKKLRYGWKGDARHYYENIDVDTLKMILRKYVANKQLVNLICLLIDSFESGLSIGSYLSQYLANLYMSFLYEYASHRLYKIRRHKDGTKSKVKLIYKILIYMDDIFALGKSKKDVKMASKILREWSMDKLKIEIKPEDETVDFKTGYVDMMGFLISRQKVIVRSRIFRRYRRSNKKARKLGMVSPAAAKTISSRHGWMTNADSKRWIRKNKADIVLTGCKEAIKNGTNVFYRKTA